MANLKKTTSGRSPMTDTREAADPFRELAKKNYAYVMVRMNKSEVREFFDGFLAHVPWARAVSIEAQEGVKLQLATPWKQLPKGTKVTVKMPRKKFGTLLLDVLRLRAPWAKVGDAVTLVTPRDKLEEFLNLLPESVKLISCPEESAQSKRRKLI
jgi:hypothetical protein